MKKLFYQFLLFFVFASNLITLNAQFIEDNFEFGSNSWNVFNAGASTNTFCIVDSIYSIEGNSLQTCSYNNNFQNYEIGYTYASGIQSEIVYRYVNTANYFNVQIGHDWKCNGEKDHDFGSLHYSIDGQNWEVLRNYQSGKGDVVLTEMLKMPKCSENSGFYFGFSFTSDNSFNFQPGLVIDNIKIYGNYCTSANKPNTPTPNIINFTKCFNDVIPISLSANSSTGNLRWYTTNSCGEFFYEGLPLTILPIEDKVFYVSSYNPNNGCESTQKSQVNLNVLDLPLLIDTTIVNATYGNDASIQASVSGAPPLSFSWSLDSDPSFSDSLLILNELDMGNYQLTITDGNNCQDSFKIVVLSGAELDIPKGISPNNDGYNDTWIITGIQQWQDFSVELRNMRGELVYRQDATDNPAYVPMNGMDANGVKLPAGDYTYVVRSKSRKRKYSGILSVKYD
jgi:gliding motility-associated-like protein